jgi:hypothetical protein
VGFVGGVRAPSSKGVGCLLFALCCVARSPSPARQREAEVEEVSLPPVRWVR